MIEETHWMNRSGGSTTSLLQHSGGSTTNLLQQPAPVPSLPSPGGGASVFQVRTVQGDELYGTPGYETRIMDSNALFHSKDNERLAQGVDTLRRVKEAPGAPAGGGKIKCDLDSRKYSAEVRHVVVCHKGAVVACVTMQVAATWGAFLVPDDAAFHSGYKDMQRDITDDYVRNNGFGEPQALERGGMEKHTLARSSVFFSKVYGYTPTDALRGLYAALWYLDTVFDIHAGGAGGRTRMYAFGVFSEMLVETALRRTGSVHAYDIERSNKQLAWAHFGDLIEDIRYIRDHASAPRTQPSDADRRVRMHVQRCINADVTTYADVVAHVTLHEGADLSRRSTGYIRAKTKRAPYTVAKTSTELLGALDGEKRSVVMYTRADIAGHAVALDHMAKFADHFTDVSFVVAMVDQIGAKNAAHVEELPYAVFTDHGVEVAHVANYGKSEEGWQTMTVFTQSQPYASVFTAKEFEKHRAFGFTGALFRPSSVQIAPELLAYLDKAAHKYSWAATILMAYTDNMTDLDNTKCQIKDVVDAHAPVLVVFKGTTIMAKESNLQNVFAMCEKYFGPPTKPVPIAKPEFLASRLRSV